MNTNFSLLKSPHIPAMLSFEWQAQGRPLNSFIAGFKTLHFKKYKSYSQMNEGWGGGGGVERELLMCPVGRRELNLPEQLESALQRGGCSILVAQPGTHLHPPLPPTKPQIPNIYYCFGRSAASSRHTLMFLLQPALFPDPPVTLLSLPHTLQGASVPPGERSLGV